MLADLQGQDTEENFFKITSDCAGKRGARVVAVDRRRLAQLQPLLRPRARRAFHHVGRRRRLPASHARARNSISVRWPEYAEEADGRRAPATPAARARARPSRRKDYNIRLKRNTKVAEGVVEQAVQDVQDAIEPLQARRAGPAPAHADQAAGAQVLSQQGPQLLLEPRQRAVSVLQPGVRHRHRPALLADHLAVPEPGDAVQHLVRQDRRPRHHHLAVERAVGHADLSGLRPHHLHQPGRSCSAGSMPRSCGTSTPSSGPRSGASSPSSSSARRTSWRTWWPCSRCRCWSSRSTTR